MEIGLSSGPCPSHLCYFCDTKQLGNWIIRLQTGSQKPKQLAQLSVSPHPWPSKGTYLRDSFSKYY